MKKRQVIIYIVVMLILITTSVYATISTELGVKVNIDEGDIIAPGDEVLVTLYLKNLTTDKNIKSVEGYIDYNKNIFEPLTVDSIVKGEDGKVKLDENNNLPVSDGSEDSTDIDKGIIFNCNPVRKDGDCRLVVNFEKPINKETDLLTLKFKVKDNAKAGDYESAIVYKLFGVFADDANESVKLDSQGLTVIISGKDSISNDTENTPNNEVNNEFNNEVNNESKNEANNEAKNEAKNETKNEAKNVTKNETKNESKKPSNNESKNVSKQPGVNGGGSSQGKDSTTAPTNLPKTGYRLVLIPIVLIAIAGLVFYKKYSKYNNYHK